MSDQLREDVFAQLFAAGVVRYVDMEIGPDGRAVIRYTMQNGVLGVIHTKRGEVKRYKAETALRALRLFGIATMKIDMKDWQPNQVQGALPL